MRSTLIVGNWKMYKTASEAKAFGEAFLQHYQPHASVEVAVAPPFVALQTLHNILSSTKIALAAQNVFWKDDGAFTGEVSVPMLQDIGCTYIIIGHSERRQHFGEDNNLINQKVHAIASHGLRPILCVGESLEERESGKTEAIIDVQLQEGLHGLSDEQLRNITIAYEPIWAIGTGLAATTQQATDVHLHIRETITKQWGIPKDSIRILYGGSVNPDNAHDLFQSTQINGALIGKACLNPESFAKIISFAENRAHSTQTT